MSLVLIPAALAAAACSRGGAGKGDGPARWSGTAPGHVALLPSTLTLQEGMSGTVSVRAFDGNGGPAAAPRLVVEPTAVATISGTTVSGVSGGSATIYAVDAIGMRPVATVVVVSAEAAPPAGASQIAAVPAHVVVPVGGARTLEAGAYGLDGQRLDQVLTYASQDPTVATITADGAVRGVAPGTTAIRISTANGIAPVSVGVTVVTAGGASAAARSLVSVVPAIGGASEVVLWAGGASFSTPMVLTYWDPSAGVRVKTTTVDGEWTSLPYGDTPWRGVDAAPVDAGGNVTPIRCGSAVIQFDPKDPSGQKANFTVSVTPDWSGTWTCVNAAPGGCADRAVATLHPLLSAPFVTHMGSYAAAVPRVPSYGALFAIDRVVHRSYNAVFSSGAPACSNLASCATDQSMMAGLDVRTDCDGTTIKIPMPIDGYTGPAYEYTCSKRSEDLCAGGSGNEGSCSANRMSCCYSSGLYHDDWTGGTGGVCECLQESRFGRGFTCETFIASSKLAHQGRGGAVARCPPDAGGWSCADHTGSMPDCQCWPR